MMTNLYNSSAPPEINFKRRTRLNKNIFWFGACCLGLLSLPLRSFSPDHVRTVTGYTARVGAITADGSHPRDGVTCAASRSIPFGTKLYIEGVGIRIVQDRLAKRFDDRVDVYFASAEAAKKFGISKRKVEIVADEVVK